MTRFGQRMGAGDQLVNSDMSEYWNGAGGEKWLGLQDQLRRFLLPFGQRVMDVLAISPGELVLDIGCGCGDTSSEIAGRIGPAGHVHGLDLSTLLLAEARARKKKKGPINQTFARGDAQNYSLEKGLFDIIFSRFGVMFFDDPVTAFKNLGSALDTGGRVGFCCWRSVMENEWVSLPLSVIANYLSPMDSTNTEEPGPFSFGDSQRVDGILSAADFVGAKIVEMRSQVPVGHTPEEAARFLLQIGPASVAISQADPDAKTRSRIAADLCAKLQTHDTGKGIYLDASAWIVTAQISTKTNSLPDDAGRARSASQTTNSWASRD